MKFLKFWLPLIIWSGLIFYASSMPADTPILRWLDILSSYAGHFFEFMVLALLSFRAFNNSFPKWGVRNVFYAGSFSILFAVSDEIHQAFVPTRFCSGSDILVDVLGVGFAFFLLRLRHRRYT
ncbi:MAG: VanZ family protein [Candidatus Ratteibacteria bacterium]|nr:VanZ family protein [Candidatus Ratteibacteria bacterium]